MSRESLNQAEGIGVVFEEILTFAPGAEELKTRTPHRQLVEQIIIRAWLDATGICTIAATPRTKREATCWLSGESEEPQSLRWYLKLLDLPPIDAQTAILKNLQMMTNKGVITWERTKPQKATEAALLIIEMLNQKTT